MPMRFNGTEGEFVRAVDDLCLDGEWCLFENGLRYRTEEGLVIMWWQTTHSVLVLGSRKLLRQYESIIESKLSLKIV